MFYCLSHAWWKAVLKEHKFVSGLMDIFERFAILKDFQIPIFLSYLLSQIQMIILLVFVKLIVQLLKLSIQMLNTFSNCKIGIYSQCFLQVFWRIVCYSIYCHSQKFSSIDTRLSSKTPKILRTLRTSLSV